MLRNRPFNGDTPITDTPSSVVEPDDIQVQIRVAAAAATDKLATNVVSLQVGPVIGITDFFLILSGRNDRQIAAIAEEVEAVLRTQHDRKPLNREGDATSGWIVLDYGDYVVHVFTEEQREIYELERLWSDAPRLDLAIPETNRGRSNVEDGNQPGLDGESE